MEPPAAARTGDPHDRGVPTPIARRPRLATATVALALAATLAGYAIARADSLGGLVAVVGGTGVVIVLAALLALWEDGLAAGAALLLLAYTIALAAGTQTIDATAPLVAAALLATIDTGSWSLELRDAAEKHPLAHLRTLGLLLAGSVAASGLVLAVGSAKPGLGTALALIGTIAGAGLLTLIVLPAKP